MGKRNQPRRSGFNTQKIFKYVRIGALLLPAVTTVLGPGTGGQKLNKLKSDYFGVWSDGSFHLESMAKGWLPFLASIGVTYGIPKIAGIIRGL